MIFDRNVGAICRFEVQLARAQIGGANEQSVKRSTNELLRPARL
jgi:hypothetical protein